MLHFTALGKDQLAVGLAIRFNLPGFSLMPLGCCGIRGRCSPFLLMARGSPSRVSLQPLVTALQMGTESLGPQSPACTLQLAQGQLLMAQHAEVQAELSQWLEEAQQAVVAFSPGSIIIGCDAFWEQQEALEVRVVAGPFGGGSRAPA